ncbi:hypothetical protein N789_14640 [Arenimonas oryziterrae DSM 21050 = YC6267]|uniref:Uncharacterized protein n=2 Tax=Arenimonas TaxID=490567 RepID=A0A091ASJ9_9GAMM|nr:hypothetical protein N789_14640 [Arenimonas oryziterrae DSM 21050 = YC6267]
MAGHFDLADSWDGWKVRGDWLISPDGDRINAQRLAGLLFVDSLSKRAAKARGKKSSLQEVVTAFRKKVAKAGEDPGS